MDKEDFIKQRMEIDHITRKTFDKTYLVIPCNCGAIYCHGYKCLEKNKIDEWLLLYIEDLQKKAEQYKSDYEKEKYLVDKLTRQLTDEYKNTEKQTEKAEHYKHLYGEVKKQKDVLIKYIKHIKSILEEYNYEPYRVNTALEDLLRMLGEIDDSTNI